MPKAWDVITASVVAATLLAGCGIHTRSAAVSLTPSVSRPGVSSRVTSSSKPAASGTPKASSRTPPSGTPTESVHRGSPAEVQVTQPALSGLQMMAASFPTPQDGFVSGTYSAGRHTAGFVAGTTNGGKTWHPLAHSATAFTSLTFENPRQGWAVGQPAALQQRSTGPQTLFRTVNGGLTWTPVEKVRGSISSVVVTRDGAWISESGPCTKTGCAGAVLKQDGATFKRVWSAPGPVLSLALHHTQMTAEVATGTSQSKSLVVQLFTTATGKTWIAGGPIASFPGYGPPSMDAPMSGQLTWTSPNDGLASVFSLGSCAMGGCGISEVTETQNGGARWSPMKSVQIGCQFQPLLAGRGRDVAVAQGVNLAACSGPQTQLFGSTDGGLHFGRRTRWPDTPLMALGMGAGGRLWAVTGGSVIVSHDGGSHWTQAFPAPTPTGLTLANSRVAYGAGDQSNPAALLKTVDGGTTWRVIGSLGDREAVAIAFPWPGDGWLGAMPLQGEFKTSAALLHTTDGGKRWSAVAGGGTPTHGHTFYPTMRFFSPTHGVWLNLPANCAGSCPAFGATTADGGQTWRVLPSPNVPGNIVSAAILSPHTFLVVTLGILGDPSGIYETTNTGKTWRKILNTPSNLNGAFDVSFPTSRVGYMVVNDVKSPRAENTPQRAVLAILKTTDGGRIWTLHDLPHVPDDWFASISFATTRDGLLATNGTLWKTTDGGRIWREMP